MSTDLTGKVAVITGASGGIGSAIALKLAACGMKIVAFGGNNLGKLSDLQKAVEVFTSCMVIPGNLKEISKYPEMVSRVISEFGGIDVLINNAGTAQNDPYETITEEQYDAMMTINCKVPYFLTQKIIPFLKCSSMPTIINIASVVAHAGYTGQSLYGASKHALLGFTKSLATEYYKDGIRVHAIAPGGVYTDMVKIARPDLTADGMIMPEDIAEIVYFFLANRTNAVVDEIIVHRLNKQPFLV